MRRAPTQPALPVCLKWRVVDRFNLRRAWQQVKDNRCAPGVDGMTDRRRVSVLHARALARHPSSLAGRHLLAATRAAGGDAQAFGRGSLARDTDRCRSVGRASHPAGPHADLRPGLLRVELRLPSRTRSARSTPAGSALGRRGLSGRRGSGSRRKRPMRASRRRSLTLRPTRAMSTSCAPAFG